MNSALGRQVASLTAEMGGTFLNQAYGNGHAEMNIVMSPAVADKQLVGIGASNYICYDCGNAILTASGGDTDVVGTPIKAPNAGRLNPNMRNAAQFSLIPDYEEAIGDEGVIEGIENPWL